MCCRNMWTAFYKLCSERHVCMVWHNSCPAVIAITMQCHLLYKWPSRQCAPTAQGTSCTSPCSGHAAAVWCRPCRRTTRRTRLDCQLFPITHSLHLTVKKSEGYATSKLPGQSLNESCPPITTPYNCWCHEAQHHAMPPAQHSTLLSTKADTVECALAHSKHWEHC